MMYWPNCTEYRLGVNKILGKARGTIGSRQDTTSRSGVGTVPPAQSVADREPGVGARYLLIAIDYFTKLEEA
jgi:hypothetical protein